MPSYNQASIDRYRNFAQNFFIDFENHKKSYPFKDLFFDLNIDILEKKNALDNYILKYYSKLDENNPVDASIKKNMDEYLKAFYSNFLSNPTELLGSPFLKNSKIVDIYCPVETNRVCFRKFKKKGKRNLFSEY